MKIKGTTQLLGVIGNPVKHSLSPLMHNAAIAQMGLDFVYVAFPIQPDNLRAAIAGFEAIDLVGFNITIPHKQTIIPCLSAISEAAQAIGAVNTVWRTEQGWQGTNTDVEGFLSPLKAMERDWTDAVAVVLGNGGAARAVVAGCAMLGFSEIHVVGRNEQRLAAFAESWAGSRWGKNLKVSAWAEVASRLPQADLIVNTTPVGMAPQVAASPLDESQMDQIKSGAIAYDLIYVPTPTQFLAQAQVRGAVTIDGLEMLVQQGAAALKIWTQREDVPVDIMRSTLQEHLGLL